MNSKRATLRSSLLKTFGILIASFGIVSAILGIGMIRRLIVDQTENRVLSDLNSAWSIIRAEMSEIQTVLELTVERPVITVPVNEEKWNDENLRIQLELTRMRFGLDFLSLMTPEGKVMVRTAPPYSAGDYLLSQPALNSARQGNTVTCLTLFDKTTLGFENSDLPQKAFISFKSTPRARPTGDTVNDRGMVILSAVPITYHGVISGVLYGGVLLNRNTDFIDGIQKSVFRDETYKGTSIGSVTFFLYDTRISTTVLSTNGHRAIGTRASKEVADHVLDNGKSWLGRAFVVRDWYETAYDPIRNHNGEIIGMLYVGILERPFIDMIHNMAIRYAALALAGLLIALLLAYLFAAYVSKPLSTLADAADRMRTGSSSQRVEFLNCSREVKVLIEAFNEMSKELAQREESLRNANVKLETTNRDYMETLGFISHELKTPLGGIMNYTYLLEQEKTGTLNENQRKAVKSIDRTTKRITEMVRRYLNLSRIENGVLEPHLVKVAVFEEIISPLIESLDNEIRKKSFTLENRINNNLYIHADYTMSHEIFENILSNAVKYGREGGMISLSAFPEESYLRFSVRNTGDGLSEEDRNRIFEKFVRVEKVAQGKKNKGTGLGLFITKHLILAHGGTIQVQSEPGQWTEFTFSMPVYNDSV